MINISFNKIPDKRSTFNDYMNMIKTYLINDIVEKYLKYNVLEMRDDVIKMVSGGEIDITIYEEFRAGQRDPITKEEIYSAIIVLGFLDYRKFKKNA